MIRKISTILTFLVLLFNFHYCALGQNLDFKHYTINEGLSQNTVFSLIQDRTGFIWIATEDGLNKFDGYEFTKYKHEIDNANTIKDSHVRSLLEDKDGNIWIGTPSGLSVYNTEKDKFDNLLNLHFNDYISSIFKDSKDNIWVGGFDGLKRFDHLAKTFLIFKFKSANKNSEINKIYDVNEDASNYLWVCTAEKLVRFDPRSRKQISLPSIMLENKTFQKATVRETKTDKNGNIWISTIDQGLFVYNQTKNTLVNFRKSDRDKNSLPSNIVRTVYFDEQNNDVLIGTRDGLSVFNRDTKKFKNYSHNIYDDFSLSHNSVRTILKDRGGNIWAGTYLGGINIAHPDEKFSFIGERIGDNKGFSYNVIGALANDEAGIWVGTEGGGLNLVTKDFSLFKVYNLPQSSLDLFHNTIKSLYVEGDSLWIGTYKGLILMNKKTGESKPYPIVSSRAVHAISKTSNGLWLGTNSDGLIHIDNKGNQKKYKNSPNDLKSISGNDIIDLLKDEKENLWIATEKGLNYFDGKTFTKYLHKNGDNFSLSNNRTISLFIDSKKRVWIGTKGGGLNLFDQKTRKFQSITAELGLTNDVINSIEEDNEGALWVSTNKGLSRIVIRDSTKLILGNVIITNFTDEDGLRNSQFSAKASFKDQDGVLYFGGINGVIYFNPLKIKRDNYTPNIVLSELLIRNKPVKSGKSHPLLKKTINETKRIVLTYDQAFFTIRFAALNFHNPTKNRYAYKLENFSNNNEWENIGNQRAVTFTNLKAGRHIFRVRTSDNNGAWINKVKSLEIIVLPPWWETWWAYLIYAAISVALLYYFYYYSSKTARLKSQLAYEHLTHQKEKELAQRKLSFFTNISHEIKTPLTLILAPLEKLLKSDIGNKGIRNQLMLIQKNSDRLFHLINQLLDFRKFETGSMQLRAAKANVVNFVNQVVLIFESYAYDKNIQIKVECENNEIEAWFDIDKMEKVFYNLLSNSLKFTKDGGNIIIKIATKKAFEKENIIIEIIDNGIGIPSDKLNTIFDQFTHYNEDNLNRHGSGIGLSFSKGLIELHHGELLVESTQPKKNTPGLTCFTVVFPAGKNHLKNKELLTDSEIIESSDNNYKGYEHMLSNTPESLAIKRKSILEESKTGKNIMLIVEDNLDLQLFIANHFEEYFNVITANNGLEGLNKALDIIPDIIISDVMMPKMSGLSFCKEIKSDERTNHIPVILLTARTPDLNKIEGIETGADDYITKPFNLRMLEARIWNLLELRKKLRERYKLEITLQPENVAINSPNAIFLQKLKKNIESNISNPKLNVEDISSELGMSRVTMYRKLKALTNQSSVEFIRKLRLERGAQLLKEKSFNISEVAYEVGFTDVDYFRKCFKKKFGKTPKEYANTEL